MQLRVVSLQHDMYSISHNTLCSTTVKCMTDTQLYCLKFMFYTFFSYTVYALKPIAKEIYSSLGTATDVCLSTCTDQLTLLSCLFFYLSCTSSVSHNLFDVICITRPACAHYRSGSGLLICHSMIWHKLHWMLEVII